VAFAFVSLINPDAFYERLFPPSLVALFLAQAAVFAVYPLLRRRLGRLTRGDLALTAGACGLMLYGLYTAITGAST